MPQLGYSQLRFLSLILMFWMAVFFLTRTALLVAHMPDLHLAPGDVLSLYVVGGVYDLSFLVFALLPLTTFLVLGPSVLWTSRHGGVAMSLLFGASVFIMLFVAVAEWLFWDEFGVRFNFIAVDYLVYSREVVDNILESYPIYPLLAGLVLMAIAAGVAMRGVLKKVRMAPVLPRRHAVVVLACVLVLATGNAALIGQGFPRGEDGNTFLRELASNGPFQFFAAFRNNELDYPQFYATLPDREVARILRERVYEPGVRFLGNDPVDIRRHVENPGNPRQLNVVLVTIESLSAKYLGSFGDARGLTPTLDALRSESLFFRNAYATGTRTDRGLEAITLSVPPTPGRSIVKRIGRESGYASLGQQFLAKGYDSVFLYGGRGYFDNMNAFFGGNGYRIVDQGSVPAQDIRFSNAWGMSDEDLYGQVLSVADEDHAAGKPFFLQVMTTSNHRPYTYPSGRIDIPSGEGREGAVKYTDYAIGKFLADARKKPWFDRTIFVFVADHNAGSAGKEDLPVEKYHIPLFVYAPGQVAPGDVDTLVSQIDLAPTLLALLNMDYTSTFFGRNVLRKDVADTAVLIGNYQHLGLFDGHDMAILSPRQAIRRHDDALGLSREQHADVQDPLVASAIAYYQGASYAFQKKLLAWQEPYSPVRLSHR